MKILLTNYSLAWLGGTQTWVKTVAAELVSLGHEVHLFAGDNKYDLLPEYPKFDPLERYDLALVNHNVCLDALEGCDIDRTIFTSHGVIPHLEQPSLGADLYVSVSEEVQQNLLDKGFPSTIIRNPIDTDTFRSIHPTREKLSRVLFMSNYQGGAREIVEKACSEAKLDLKIFGKKEGVGEQADALTAMNDADLVIGLGRTAYEAMACERNVIVFDYNGADGFATPQALMEMRKCNCSGRAFKVKYSVDDLKAIFGLYNPEMGKKLRQFVIENNNVKQITQEYLSLIKSKK